MSDRPRTDALFDRCKNKSNIECMAELEELCRTIEEELSDVTKQRDALAEAMNEMWLFIEEDDHPNCNTPAFNAAIAKYKAALAAVKGDSDE